MYGYISDQALDIHAVFNSLSWHNVQFVRRQSYNRSLNVGTRSNAPHTIAPRWASSQVFPYREIEFDEGEPLFPFPLLFQEENVFPDWGESAPIRRGQGVLEAGGFRQRGKEDLRRRGTEGDAPIGSYLSRLMGFEVRGRLKE